jgi:hypothetical protein
MEQIHAAIADPEWQKLRLSLKGQSTRDKLTKLEEWLSSITEVDIRTSDLDRFIQVQNYLNALARGGQIEPCNLQLSVRDQIKQAVILR